MEVSLILNLFSYRIAEKLKHASKDYNPGVGSYNIPSKIQEGPKFSVPHSKKAFFPINTNPGPLEYNPIKEKVLKHYPSYTMRGKQEGKNQINSPGPGKYYPVIDDGHKSYK